MRVIFGILFIVAFLSADTINPYWFQEDSKERLNANVISKDQKEWVNPYWFQETKQKDEKKLQRLTIREQIHFDS
ncbi:MULTISPECIES: hypothetical protein [unclassified Nitratiruptor]|uniref:hypothetical protein n=1 Tax=unclassified Nitratiruptor TaxID=2624044 RepID=UPI001914DE33|nr:MULTISPECIES: hypothetical protein [unclassified Nitratiruptor]BCD59816.1 hypothetical protein NitYY0810_C0573 [Nitratiruptor sp. YY08-10]BCD63740.1 hypothetical protein NitYY0814_C0573 [Nitratiruptor sp. YY08-14]